IDLIEPETAPGVRSGDDDRGLEAPERAHLLERTGVGGDVDHGVLDPLLVERAVGRVALDARRLAVHGDLDLLAGHDASPTSFFGPSLQAERLAGSRPRTHPKGASNVSESGRPAGREVLGGLNERSEFSRGVTTRVG